MDSPVRKHVRILVRQTISTAQERDAHVIFIRTFHMIQIESAKQAKKTARALEKYLATLGIELEHGNALNAIAVMAGNEDWNALAALVPAVPSDSTRESQPAEQSQHPLAADAIRALLSAMDMQERRESGELHLTAHAAMHIWSHARTKAETALKSLSGNGARVDVSSELYIALSDLVDALSQLRDGSLPDCFDYRTLSHAKAALAFCRSTRQGIGSRSEKPARSVSARNVGETGAKENLSHARLFLVGAETANTSWSLDFVLALPGQTVGHAIADAFLRREPDANLEEIDFWYREATRMPADGFTVRLNGVHFADTADFNDAVIIAQSGVFAESSHSSRHIVGTIHLKGTGQAIASDIAIQ